MKKLFPVFQFVKYWLCRVNEHAIHSPFLFDFYTRVIKADQKEGFDHIEALRKMLLSKDDTIEVKELGAGSRVTDSNRRVVRHIARYATTPARFSRLLSRIIRHFQCKTILELGTSLGLNTLYLQQGNPAAVIHTIEGSPQIAKMAREHFAAVKAENITVTEGNLDDVLKPVLTRLAKIDFVYMDANHRYEPTLRYFNWLLPQLHDQSIVVLDDIHWSREMNEAWKEIIKRPEVVISIDLFEAGLLFFDPSKTGGHYTLKF